MSTKLKKSRMEELNTIEFLPGGRTELSDKDIGEAVTALRKELRSLVETECPRSKPSNNLRVFYDRPESGDKQGFAVCSKSLSHLEDESQVHRAHFPTGVHQFRKIVHTRVIPF